MRYHPIGLALAAALMLAGCAGATAELNRITSEVNKNVIEVSKFAVVDLRSALKSAQAHNNRIAVMCWTELIKVAERGQTEGAFEIKGPISAFQQALNLSRLVTGKLSEDLQIACAPLFLDVQAILARLAAL